MAVRSAISVGFPGANYVVELGQRESALPGEYIVEGGQAIVVVTTGQIDNLTLAATGAVTAVAQASPTIANLTISGVGNIAVTASLTKTIDPITLAATGEVVVSAAVDATIDEITSDATGLVIRAGGDLHSDRAGVGGGPISRSSIMIRAMRPSAAITSSSLNGVQLEVGE